MRVCASPFIAFVAALSLASGCGLGSSGEHCAENPERPGTAAPPASVEPDPEPASEPASEPAPETKTPQATGQAPKDVDPALVGVYRCEGERPHIAKFHTAQLGLRADGSFELSYKDVHPMGGESRWIKGRYRTTWEEDLYDDGGFELRADVVITPVEGLVTEWTGDAHKHAHGEFSGYRENVRRGVYTHDRALPVTLGKDGPRSIYIKEIGTSVYREPEGGWTDTVRPGPCDPGRYNGRNGRRP